MWFLAFSAAMDAGAVLGHVTRSEAIQAQVVGSDGREHLVMGQTFEAGAHIQRVFL